MSFLKDLRGAYPRMPMGQFIEIVTKYRESDELLARLDEAERPAADAFEAHRKAWKELLQRVSASEQHHHLHFVVPPKYDLEHVQAIIMYGFLMPGSGISFIGAHALPIRHVHTNVRNKLGRYRFDETKYQLALEFLIKEGVVCPPNRDGHKDAISLNQRAGKETSSHGEQILRVALDYAIQKKLRK